MIVVILKDPKMLCYSYMLRHVSVLNLRMTQNPRGDAISFSPSVCPTTWPFRDSEYGRLGRDEERCRPTSYLAGMPEF